MVCATLLLILAIRSCLLTKNSFVCCILYTFTCVLVSPRRNVLLLPSPCGYPLFFFASPATSPGISLADRMHGRLPIFLRPQQQQQRQTSDGSTNEQYQQAWSYHQSQGLASQFDRQGCGGREVHRLFVADVVVCTETSNQLFFLVVWVRVCGWLVRWLAGLSLCSEDPR